MKKLFLVLILTLSISLVGCTQSEELDNTNESEIKTSSAGSKISNMKQIEELKKYSNKADEKYFKPQTDDFVVALTYTSDYDTDHNSTMKLYSFDKDGRLVQFVERDYQSYGFGNYILNDEEKEATTIEGNCKYQDIIKYYSILEGATPIDEMYDQDRFSQKFEVLEGLKRNEYPLYFSKSLTRDQVNFKMTRTESEVSQVLFIPSSDDYLVQLDEKEEYHEARFTYEGELVCDAFAVKRGNVIEFNDKGEISKNTRFEILQDGYN
ncbi:MAG: hypothetical protein MJ246_07800 [Clostridia bacterium]|nr:hypothetical protein [Clostridia bacterium]